MLVATIDETMLNDRRTDWVPFPRAVTVTDEPLAEPVTVTQEKAEEPVTVTKAPSAEPLSDRDRRILELDARG